VFSQRGIEGRRHSVLFSSYLFERQRLTEWCLCDRLMSVCLLCLTLISLACHLGVRGGIGGEDIILSDHPILILGCTTAHNLFWMYLSCDGAIYSVCCLFFFFCLALVRERNRRGGHSCV
jgi:hypothetical protein